MKDTKKIYWIEQRCEYKWIEVSPKPLDANVIDERLDWWCREFPGVAFRKIEAEILE